MVRIRLQAVRNIRVAAVFLSLGLFQSACGHGKGQGSEDARSPADGASDASPDADSGHTSDAAAPYDGGPDPCAGVLCGENAFCNPSTLSCECEEYYSGDPNAGCDPDEPPCDEIPGGSSPRHATSADSVAIPHVNVGDLIVTGPGNDGGASVDESWSLTPGQKIVIVGDSYDYISISNPSAGSTSDPIVITNACGQVETSSLSIRMLSFFKLTGKYDPAAQTGDVAFRGHDAGYAWSHGTYGIFVNRSWADEWSMLIDIRSDSYGGTVYRSDNFEIEYVESGNGGYSNAIKWDANDTYGLLENIRIHDCYFHDIAGECLYLGYSESAPHYELFENLKIFNNRFIRCGNEGMQVKRYGAGTEIYNNASVSTGMGCYDSQNFATVLWPVGGSTSVRNNLYVGNSGYASVQYYASNDVDYSIVAGVSSFSANAILHMGVEGVIWAGAHGLQFSMNDVTSTGSGDIGPATIEFDGNLWGFVLPGAGSEYVVADNDYYPSTSAPLVATNNIYDGSGNGRDGFWRPGTATSPTTDSGNSEGTVNDAEFVNLDYGTGFSHQRFNFWGAPWSDSENSYSMGWYVAHRSRIYKAINSTPATDIEPGVTPGWQSYWALQTYNGGLSYLPADDVRMASGSFYHTANIGLLDRP